MAAQIAPLPLLKLEPSCPQLDDDTSANGGNKRKIPVNEFDAPEQSKSKRRKSKLPKKLNTAEYVDEFGPSFEDEEEWGAKEDGNTWEKPEVPAVLFGDHWKRTPQERIYTVEPTGPDEWPWAGAGETASTVKQFIEMSIEKEVRRGFLDSEPEMPKQTPKSELTTAATSLDSDKQSSQDDNQFRSSVIKKMKTKLLKKSSNLDSPMPVSPASASESEKRSTSESSPARGRDNGRSPSRSLETGNVFGCSFCNAVYSEIDLLEKHSELHEGSLPFVCLECQAKFADSEDLVRHVAAHKKIIEESINLSKKPRKKVVAKETDKQEDQDSNSHINEHFCQSCKSTFSTAAQLSKHASTHSKKLYICRICHIKFTLQDQYLRHKKTHQSRLPCPQCDMDFLSKEELKSHERIHNIIKRYRTEHPVDHNDLKKHHQKLQKAESNLLTFQLMRSKMHEIIEKELTTNGLGSLIPKTEADGAAKPEVEASSLAKSEVESEPQTEEDSKDSNIVDELENKEIKTENDEIETKTEQTESKSKNTSFSMFSSLIKPKTKGSDIVGANTSMRDVIEHVIDSTLESLQENTTNETAPTVEKQQQTNNDKQKGPRPKGDKPFKCDTCSVTFSQNYNLVRHLKTHSGIKPWECDTCHVRFTQKYNLLKHQLIHTDTKPFSCRYCDKKFRQQYNCEKHERVHTKVRPYACNDCTMKFSAIDGLKRHQRSHLGLKPYKCSECNSSFSTSTNVRKHMLIHTGQRPWVCQVCDRGFTQSTNLQRHMKVHDKKSDETVNCPLCPRTFSRMLEMVHHKTAAHPDIPESSPSKRDTSSKHLPLRKRKHFPIIDSTDVSETDNTDDGGADDDSGPVSTTSSDTEEYSSKVEASSSAEDVSDMGSSIVS